MSDVLELVAKRAQKHISLRPLLILGSGASIPHGIPSMSSIATSLVTKISNRTPEWIALTTELRNGADLEIALQNVTVPEVLLAEIVKTTWETIAAADVAVYDDLLHGTTTLPLTNLFTHLLRTATPRLSVITTNYDRLAEYAGEQAGVFPFCGFTAGHLGRFQATFSNPSKPFTPTHSLSILKVHGSLDWFCDADRRLISKMNASTIPSAMLPMIVTPGVSKYREALTDPFRSILFHSDAALMDASSFLAIGFGFNDDHIQPKIHDRVCLQGAPLVVLAETLTTSVHVRFLKNPCKEFLFLEKDTNGTKVYAPEFPTGETIPGMSLWSLPEFLRLIT